MKLTQKVLLGFTSVFLITSLTGCDLLFGLLGGYEEEPVTKTINVTERGDVFLYKYNLSNSKIDYKNTGLVVGNPEDPEDFSMYAGNEETVKATITKPGTLPANMRNNSYVEELNANLMKDLEQNFNRAAGSVTYKPETETSSPNYNQFSKEYFKYIIEENDTKRYVEREFQWEAGGEHCNVWYVDDLSFADEDDFYKEDLFDNLALTFDKIYNYEEKILGDHKYTSSPYNNFINPKFKINILVADLIEQASENQDSGTYGYFSQTDLIRSKTYGDDEDYNGYEDMSNHDMIIYVDAHFLLKDPKAVYSTIAHEYTHLLNFVNKTIKNGVTYDTWFTEMMAMLSEDLFQNYLGLEATKDGPISRLPYYFTENAHLGFTTWLKGNDVFYSYANAYAFGAYLVRNYGGVDLLTKMATNRYSDIKAVTEATGSSMDTLMINYSDCLLYPTETSKTYYNLNHKITYSYDTKLYFPAINLTQLSYYYWQEVEYSDYVKETNKENKKFDSKARKYYLKKAFVANPLYYVGGNYLPDNIGDYHVEKVFQIGLAPYGMSLHYVGRYINSFNFQYYESKNTPEVKCFVKKIY